MRRFLGSSNSLQSATLALSPPESTLIFLSTSSFEKRNDPKIFINPEYKVLEGHSLFEYEEGCLSIPGFNEKISRPDKIELKWQDINGKEHITEPEGLLTVCIQHEIDHLEGKLMVDYVSALKRDRVRNKLLKEYNRK